MRERACRREPPVTIEEVEEITAAATGHKGFGKHPQFGTAVGPEAMDAAQRSALEACPNPDGNEMAAALPTLYRELTRAVLADLALRHRS